MGQVEKGIDEITGAVVVIVGFEYDPHNTIETADLAQHVFFQCRVTGCCLGEIIGHSFDVHLYKSGLFPDMGKVEYE